MRFGGREMLIRDVVVMLAIAAMEAGPVVSPTQDGAMRLPRPATVEFEFVGLLKGTHRYEGVPGQNPEPTHSQGMVRGAFGEGHLIYSDALPVTTNFLEIPVPGDLESFRLSAAPSPLKDVRQEVFVVISPDRAVTWRVLGGGSLYSLVSEVPSRLRFYRELGVSGASGMLLLTHRPSPASGLTFAEMLEQSVPPPDVTTSPDRSSTTWRSRTEFGALSITVDSNTGAIQLARLALGPDDLPDEASAWLGGKLVSFELEGVGTSYAPVGQAVLPSTGYVIERWRTDSGGSFERRVDFQFRFEEIESAAQIAAAVLAQIPEGTEARLMQQDAPYKLDGIVEEWRAGRVQRVLPASTIQAIDNAIVAAGAPNKASGRKWILVAGGSLGLGACAALVLLLRYRQAKVKLRR